LKRISSAMILVLVMVAVANAQTGVKKKRPLSREYGRVVLNNSSEKAGMPAVAFDHWFHRSEFTCRLCHVDIAFGMKSGSTAISAADNISGFYCGTCHNGRMTFQGVRIFESCSPKGLSGDPARCRRCHSAGTNAKPVRDFAEFTKLFPKERFGNGIDWEKAEAEGRIRPVDILPGISVVRKGFLVQKDFSIEAKLEGLPDIVFSHRKHTIWNGCELCHPEIFVGVRKGTTQYSMVDIFDGRSCGVCHGKVAFPLIDCQRCHVKPVTSRPGI